MLRFKGDLIGKFVDYPPASYKSKTSHNEYRKGTGMTIPLPDSSHMTWIEASHCTSSHRPSRL